MISLRYAFIFPDDIEAFKSEPKFDLGTGYI